MAVVDVCDSSLLNFMEDKMELFSILYELLIYAEWQQEREGRGGQEKQIEKGRNYFLWGWLGPFAPVCCPPLAVQKLINLQMAWQFAVGGDGRVVAVLQDHGIEIRSSRDKYATILGRCVVFKDPHPQWRKLAWSPDCTMLAVAHSNGTVDFFDLLGSNLFTISKGNSSNAAETWDFMHSVAGMVFADLRTRNTQWSFEFILVTYKGHLQSYLVSPTDGYQEGHSFSFKTFIPNGVTCITYHPTNQLLIVGSRSSCVLDALPCSKAADFGITAWRFLSDFPHYKLVTSLEEEEALAKKGWMQRIPSLKLYAEQNYDAVYKLSISPGAQMLAVVHTSGALSLWHLPSLHHKALWELPVQPSYKAENPQYQEPLKKRKSPALISESLGFHITDVSWWSDEALILARSSGAVVVASVSSLKNLLGNSPEWFEVCPQISVAHDRGFLGLECETRISTKKRQVDKEQEGHNGEESSDDEDSSVFTHTTEIFRKALYFVTDSERFQPRRKIPKILTKQYRLLCLKSTTPEELFSRKIDNEEYGEALALAKAYGLDRDLVYQRQWRKTPVSVASIQDYLSKITKHSWVLHECIERVPESLDAAKELLLYGLRGTDLEALIAIGKKEDNGRFILTHPVEFYDDIYSMYPIDEEELERRKVEKEKQRRKNLLKDVNFKTLTLEQKQLCQCRLKLFTYFDRLITYETILGGPFVAEEHYDHNFFQRFRLQCGHEAALNFAHSNNWRAVAAMFTYHGSETLPHRLAILSNFPETTAPSEYRSLLPEVGCGPHEPEVYSWDEVRTRDEDWCESKYIRSVSSPVGEDFISEFYEEHKELLKYKGKLTGQILTEWYSERARGIESYSHLVDNALELVKLGRERNVQGLERLHDELVTMETLVYECHIDKSLTFKEMEGMSNMEKLLLLLSTSTETTYVKNIKQWLLPFLQRCERHREGSHKQLMKEYMVTMAVTDLCFCQKIFEHSRIDQPDPIISDAAELISLVLECLFACERTDQLHYAFAILECIPQRGYGNNISEELHDRTDELEKYLSVAEILEQNSIPVTLGFLQSCSQSAEKIKKLLTKLTRMASHKNPPLDENQWKHLLCDLLDMQENLFKSISIKDCYEIFVAALLCSEYSKNINLAGQMMECSHKTNLLPAQPNNPMYSRRLSYKSAIYLVLSAAREYFNSSATLSDPCMSLARECLLLIEDIPASIEEELDLIASLAVLDEFSVKILPLQVRLCENRLELVKRVLTENPKAYKTSQKLLKLAYLLRVCGEDSREREAKVLSLIAVAAFEAKDYSDCYKACQLLMVSGHQEGWAVCHQLGECIEFTDILSKCELMAFALAHCSPDLIEPILRTRAELHLQLSYERIKFLMGDDFEESSYTVTKMDDMSSSDNTYNGGVGKVKASAVWQTGEKTLQVLNTTSQTTKAVISTLFRSGQFWKNAVSWMQPLSYPWDNVNGDPEHSNKDLTKQGICAFYDVLFDSSYISKLEPDYFRFASQIPSHSLELATLVLRASLMEDTLEITDSSCVNSQIILDLAKIFLPEDATLSLAYLLSLRKGMEAEEFFAMLPSTSVVLHIAAYYFVLRLHIKVYPWRNPNLNPIYLDDPAHIVKQVLDELDKENFCQFKSDEDFQKCGELVQKYNDLLFNFIQAEVLKSMGGGVDVARFTVDDVYKKETILGLAMTVDDGVLNIALSLACHYKLSLWEVYMSHLEYLFTDSSLSTSEIESRIKKLEILKILTAKPIQFKDQLENYVYPNIDGRDLSRLLLYFTLMGHCDEIADETGVKPNEHIRILKKLKVSCPSIDYKSLMKSSGSPLDILYPHLNAGNVHVFAKLANKIPVEKYSFLQPTSVFCVWAKKLFFEGSSYEKKEPKTNSEWFHRYEACSDYIHRLSSQDLLDFITNITFSSMALDKLTTDCRIEITKRALKFCRQKIPKIKDEVECSQWNIIVNCFQHNLAHLQSLEDEIIVGLKMSKDPQIQGYAREFDLSQSQPEKLHSMVLRAVIEGQSLSLIQTLLAIFPSDLAWEPVDAFSEAIKLVTEQLRHPHSIMHTCFEDRNPLEVLQIILIQISENNDELMMEEMALELLRPFCFDSFVPVQTRLQVLQLLEKTTKLAPEDMELLLLFRTQALVAVAWPSVQVSEDCVADNINRECLFKKLLESSHTINHLTTLASILRCWPPLSSSTSSIPEHNPWTVLLCALADIPDSGGLDEFINLLDTPLNANYLNLECCWTLYQKVASSGSLLNLLKVAFKTPHQDIHKAAVEALSKYSKLSTEDYDEELLKLVLLRHLTSSLVSTELYNPLIEFLISHEEEVSPEDTINIQHVVDELQEAGHYVEAGTLLHLSHDTHPSLRTYSSALDLLQRWMSNRQ